MISARFVLIALLLPAAVCAQDFRYQTQCKAKAKLVSDSSSFSASATTTPRQARSAVPATRTFSVPIASSSQLVLVANVVNPTTAPLQCQGAIGADSRAHHAIEINSVGDGTRLRTQLLNSGLQEAQAWGVCALPAGHLAKTTGVASAELPFKTLRTATLRIEVQGSLSNPTYIGAINRTPNASDFAWVLHLYRDSGSDCDSNGDPLLRTVTGSYRLGAGSNTQVIDIPNVPSDNYVLALEWTGLATMDLPRNTSTGLQVSDVRGRATVSLTLR